MNRIQLLLVIGITISTQFALGQAKPTMEYLQNVGTLDSLYSNSLMEYRKFYVQLPTNYNAKNKDKYPVVYILDGEVFLPTVHNVHEFYSGGFMPEMVLIGISNENNRMRDLTTSKITSMNGMPFDMENGEADSFSEFIGSELIPFVENKYPVTNFRTLIGHSYGGLFTIYSLIHHPQLFNNYLAIDPSLDWDNQKLLAEANEKLSSNNYELKSLFLSLGGQLNMQNPEVTIDNVMEDTTELTIFARSNIGFSNVVKKNTQNNLAFEWKFYPRDLHGTISFPSIMDGLISVFEWYQMENIHKFNIPTTSAAELNEIVRYRQNKLETHFGYPVPPYPDFLINVSGYMSMDSDQMERAKMFFELAIEFYPNNPNTYDSMADYYERNGDIDNALKFATKAFEMSGDDYYKERIETLKKN